MRKTDDGRLPEGELAVMQILWRRGEAMGCREMQSQPEARGWSASTLYTLLDRLTAKGYVAVEQAAGPKRYRPRVAREDYLAAASRRFFRGACGGSVNAFAAALVDGGLSREELAELRRLLEEGAL